VYNNNRKPLIINHRHTKRTRQQQQKQLSTWTITPKRNCRSVS